MRPTKNGMITDGLMPPIKVEYSLIDFGKALNPLLNSITDWGNYLVENLKDVTVNNQTVNRVIRDIFLV